MKLKLIRIIAIGNVFSIIVFVSVAVHAASAVREAKKAGCFYQEGKYDEALAGYDKALLIKPNDPGLHYNRAATLYRKGDFQSAGEAFLQSLAAGDERMEKKSVYNAGNSRYRMGETAEKADPGSALKNYTEAVQYYRRAMEWVPEDNDAKYNYEFTMKKIQDLEQQEEEEKKDQQQKEEEEDQQQEKEQKKDQQKEDQDQQKKQKEQEKDLQKEEKDREQEEKKPRQQDEKDQEKQKEKLR